LSEITDWLTAIGTCGAVITSLYFAAKDTRERRRHDERAQAEKLTAWFVPYEGEQDNIHKIYLGLRIKNSSDELIYDVIAESVSLQGAFRHTAVGDTDERNREFGVLVGNIAPGEYTTRINYGGGGMHKRFWIELAFQDAAGRFWVRHGDGKLERVNKHPIDLYNLSRPVSWQN
jgi:hypothetical protein